MLTPEEQKYLDLMNSRSNLGEQSSPDMVDDEMPTPKPAPQAAAPAAAPKKDAGLDAAGDATMMASGGNPYVAGAGLALKTVGMVDDAKRQSEQAKINAYNQKIMAQRSAIRNFFA